MDLALRSDQRAKQGELARRGVVDPNGGRFGHRADRLPEVAVAPQQATAGPVSPPARRAVLLAHVPRIVVGRLAPGAKGGVMGHVVAADGRGAGLVVGAVTGIIGGDPPADLGMHRPAAEHEIALGQHVTDTVQVDRQQVEVQLLGQVEGPAVEASDPAVGRARPLGEDDDRIAAADQVGQPAEIGLDAVRHGVELRIADHQPVDRVAVDPVVGQHDEVRGQHQDAHQVEVRLVVADDDRGFVEPLADGVVEREARTRHTPDDEARGAADEAVQAAALALGRAPDAEVEERRGQHQQEHADTQEEDRVERAGDPWHRDGHGSGGMYGGTHRSSFRKRVRGQPYTAASRHSTVLSSEMRTKSITGRKCVTRSSG